MEFLQVFLPTVLYCLAIVLVIILIILGLKAIETMNKLNTLLDDTQKKLNTLDGFFNIMDTVTNKVSVITDTMVSAVTNVITSIVKKRKRKKEETENNEL